MAYTRGYNYGQMQPYIPGPTFTPMPLDYMSGQLEMLQQRHDLTNQMMSAKMDEVAGLEYVDQKARDWTMNKLQTDLDEINDKYRGDLARGASDVIRRIGQERKNAWYDLNRYQVEQSKIYQEAMLQGGSKAIGFRDPRKAELMPEEGQFIQDREDLTADVGLREDIPLYVERKYADIKPS